jgi:hypothetical protein
MAQVKINVPKGLGDSFRWQLSCAGIRHKESGCVTHTRKGGNDSVFYDDQIFDASEQATINQIIQNHDPTTIADPSSVELEQNGWFIEDETKYLRKLSTAELENEDLAVLIDVIKEIGPEGLADAFGLPA